MSDLRRGVREAMRLIWNRDTSFCWFIALILGQLSRDEWLLGHTVNRWVYLTAAMVWVLIGFGWAWRRLPPSGAADE